MPRAVPLSGNAAAGAALQMHVLDLDVAGRPVRRFEQEVHARTLAVGDLAAQGRVARERRDRAGSDSLLGKRVGPATR